MLLLVCRNPSVRRMSKVAEVGDCWGRLQYPLLYSGRERILVEVDAARPVASASATVGNAEETP
jgi:hypothetical protein